MPNRLAAATSPYLLQHAQNPVEWWEWGPEAFAEAKRRDIPVLLSVGYAACHWCHVMAHESFEDDAVAAYLNEHFVAIKVDREERPDVDAVYMQATVAMTGQGGWPMTCVLDHEGNPFFAGTYFPDRPRHGQPSFSQLLAAITDAWQQRRNDVLNSAANIASQLAREVALVPAPVDAGVLDAAIIALSREYDEANGGFGTAPKFPPSMVLEFLRLHGSKDARRMLNGTLEAMARGGMYDQLGGGFARYSVDAGWVVPHFEKMLYDNAQLLGLYARVGGELGERIARETAEFMLRELRTDEGGFASALDADTEGVEGRFYVWTPGQLTDVLGEEDGQWAATLLHVTATGTFEHGSSTLQLRSDPGDAARWERIRSRLLEHRERRTGPARDDKVVAAWNGLAITALVDAGLLLAEPTFAGAAIECGELLARVHLDGNMLRRVSRDGIAGSPAGVLEDYGLVADAFLALACATADQRWLKRAGALLDKALADFGDGSGSFYDTAADAETLVLRPRDPSDNASPSGHSAMIRALTRYAALTGSGHHRDAAEAALRSVAGLITRVPRFAGWSLVAATEMLAGPAEVAVITIAGDASGQDLAALARRTPGAVVVVAEPGTTGIPLLDGRELVGGRAAAYVCRNLVCQRPVTDTQELRALLSRPA
jgi:uncharacterized protein YyaL (SSP411 family)